MFSKSNVIFLALSFFAASQPALARERWLERNGRAVLLHPRRFGQEHPAVIDKLSAACPGQVCGNLAGAAITPLLAAQPECSQQDMADSIIDASRQFDNATQANMIALAQEYRQAEKNTPPDFTTNPPSLRNSVFCQKAPKNAELNGLVQAQDPSNDPQLFFDPATKATVIKGTQANTSPFNGTVSSNSSTVVSTTSLPTGTAVRVVSASTTSCATAVTVTITATSLAASTTQGATIFYVGDATSAPAATSTGSANIGNFGSCSVPEIKFGVGFDGRKETSFEPVDETSYPHGSADNIAVIASFICSELKSPCGADQTALNTCAVATAAAAAAQSGTGFQADAFNAAFGITTNFGSVASVDNTGNVVPGTGSSTTSASSSTATGTSGTSTSSSTNIGSFGSCSIPEIKFGTGFDNRVDTSFEPVNQTSYDHGPAQNIDIISQFICDTLVNSCGADATAQATCATAKAAADTAPTGSGAQADRFNSVFGIETSFADTPEINDQGQTVTASAAATTSTAANNNNLAASSTATAATAAATTTKKTSTAAASTAPAAVTTQAATSSSSSSSSGSSSSTSTNLQTFTGSLGGVTAPAVTALGNGQFQVAGNNVFNDEASALQRSCDVQNNECADAANASGNQNGFTVASCTAQQQTCLSNASSAS